MAVVGDDPNGIEPLARLRRLIDALARGEVPSPGDAIWFVVGAGAYLAAAGTATLSASLGLGHCWRRQKLAVRDEAIRHVAGAYFAGLSAAAAAKAIDRAARRIERGGEGLRRAVPGDKEIARLIASGMKIPACRQLAAIVARKRAISG